MKFSKTTVAAASFAACAFLAAPTQAADVASSKGILQGSWNYVQYLFADGAASAALNDASKAAAAKSNPLGMSASRELQIQAEAQLQQRDFIGADKTLRRALSLAPELVKTQALLAVAIHGQGRTAEARGMLDTTAKTTATAPSSANAKTEGMSAVASAYNSLGDPKTALQIYNQLLANNADSAALHTGRGEALQLLNDDVAALASFQLASELEPRFPNLEFKRAQSLERLGRASEAENAYRVALQLDPASGAARTSVARLETRRPATAGDLPTTTTTTTTTATTTATPVVVAAAAPTPTPAKADEAKPSDKASSAEKATAFIAAALSASPDKAAAAKTPAATPEKAGTTDAPEAVLAQLSKWQAAWSSKEVGAYLGFYAKTFTPVKMKRTAWEADRRAKVGKPGTIQVNIIEPSFELDGNVMKVTFAQEYISSNFSDKTRKRIDWVQEGGEWRIQREVTL